MAETLRQAKAFDLYYAMGSDRSYEAVSQEIGVSKNSIYAWSKKFNWQDRVKERDNANVKRMYEETDNNIVSTMVSYRKVISASVADYIKNLKEGKVKINSASDFIKLVELDIKIAELMNTEKNASIADNDKNNKTIISFNLTKKDVS